MDATFEDNYHRVEETQWWCKARRQMVLQLVRETAESRDAIIFEVGCSSGMLLADLAAAGYMNVSGVDLSSAAIARAHERGLTRAALMDGAKLEMKDSSVDLLVASDVLEHIEDDAAAVREWHRVLRPGGALVIFVPACPFLWSAHDEVNHHYRRYSAHDLQLRLRESGYAIVRLSYWNFLLTVPGVFWKLLTAAFPALAPRSVSEGPVLPAPILNRALCALICYENRLLRRWRFPFGTSVFAIARKV